MLYCGMHPAALPIGTAPVLAFLGLLVFLDSFKLVPLRSVSKSLIAGLAAAALALVVNTWLLDGAEVAPGIVRRYLAPVVEETAKALYILFLLRKHRIGFVVDAAVHGFAVGAGFAVAENLHYARTLGDAGLALWIVRGFGTAVMHGSTTAMYAAIARSMRRRGPIATVGGLALAIAVHSFFNHFVLPPLAMAGLLLATLPPLALLVFRRSEAATRSWLGSGFDTDLELLDLLVEGDVRVTPVGSYLQELRNRFAPAVLGDMLCYLRIYLELSMRAKSQLIAREAGLELDVGEEVRANLEELRYLEKSIGKTGKLALHPFLRTRSRDLWQLGMLRQGRRYSIPKRPSSPA